MPPRIVQLTRYQALFSGGLLLLAEKAFLRYVAINFHRKALADRIAENQLGLRALDRLSNAQPAPKRFSYKTGQKGHRSRGSSMDILGMNGRRSRPGSRANSPERNEKLNGRGGTSSNGSGSSSPAPLKEKKEMKRNNKRQRRNVVAAVIVDQLGGALEQVTQSQFGSLESAGKLARKLFSALSDVHPPRQHLIVEGELSPLVVACLGRWIRGNMLNARAWRLCRLLPVLPDGCGCGKFVVMSYVGERR